MTQDLEAIPKLVPKTESIPGMVVGKIRPLYSMPGKEAFLYAYLSGLPVNHEECPNLDKRQLEVMLKKQIALMESRKPGLRAQLLSKLARRLRDYPQPEGKPLHALGTLLKPPLE